MLEAEFRKCRRGLTIEVRIQLEPGEGLGLFGPSGAGKSTVLAAIAGLIAPDAGTIVWRGQRLFPPPLPLRRRPLGYLTQEPNLFPHLSVAENVGFGLPRPRLRSPEQQAWLAQLAHRFDLTPHWDASAARLSGGQARRVALARMLARRPPLVLLDEPFAGLDRALVRSLVTALREWQAEIGFALIAVDHQGDVLSQLCPRVAAMLDGKIVQQGSWPELRRAPEPRIAALLAPL